MTSATTMSPGRVARAYAMEARFETLRALRQPAFAAPMLLLPAALYLLFTVVLFAKAIQKEPGAPAYMLAGFAVLGMMGPGLFGGIFVALEREKGALALRRAQPVPMAAYLSGKTFVSLLFGILAMAGMTLAGATLGRVGLGASQYLALTAISVAGSLPFCAIGLFIGSRTSGKTAPAFANLVYLPMIYLSGFLFPLPASMKWVAFLSPASHLDQLALRAVGLPVTGNVTVNVAFLVVTTALFGGLAARRLARKG